MVDGEPHPDVGSAAAPAGTQAAVRAIRLLKSFSRSRPEHTLGELCVMHALTKTTAHRLLGALESEGLIARNAENGAYRLGPAALALGLEALQSHDLRAQMHPVLERLAREAGETATLELLHEGMVLILDEVPGPQLLSSSGHIGTRWPLHATSTGKVLLALQPAALASLPRVLASYTRTTITSRQTLARELQRVRERGYATVLGELEEGYNAVAVPVRNALGDVAGAVSLGGASTRLGRRTLTQLAEQLRVAVDAQSAPARMRSGAMS
jgi:IclR family transcriptional regulator, acetate operon repressor